MDKKLFFITITALILVPLSMKSQGVQLDSTKNLKIAVLPIAFYTPETAFGFGALTIGTFHLKDEGQETRRSSAQVAISYTTKNQFLLYAPFEFYKDEEKWRLVGELGFYKYFYNFFGVGINSRKEDAETYETFFPRARISILREVLKDFSIGIGYELDAFTKLKIEEGGILEASDVIGKRDGTVSNIGVRAFYDTRDHLFYPTKGFFVQGSYLTSSKILGSSFKYSKFELDNRFYQRVGKNQVFASNLFIAQNSSGVPFYDLNYIGSKRTRGFDDRRFQDNAELSLVMEYRFPIWRRFGGVAFGSTGTVAPDLGKTFSSAYKNSGGVGLRYIINKRDGVRVRIDYGITGEGSNFYFTIREAF